MSNDNLKLWDSVQKTDPAFTKKANVKGNNITAICPHYQIKKGTEMFGVYGQTWGFKELSVNYTLAQINGLVEVRGVFFFPDGEFPILNSISIWRDNAMTKADDQFAKKAETDMLTKAMSKLGFNADVFLGMYDDVRYVQHLNEEKQKPVVSATKADVLKAIKSAKTLDALKEAWTLALSAKVATDAEVVTAKDEAKAKLS